MIEIEKDYAKCLSIAEFSSALKEFMRVNFISVTDLESICENAKMFSRTSCHRLKNGQVNENNYLMMLPTLEEKLEKWMIAKHWTTAKISENLDTLFPHRKDTKMIINRSELIAPAVKFFGLTADPFDVDRVPGEEEFFSNPELDDIALRIRDAVIYKRFIAITGGVGTGKTSMKIRVFRNMDEEKIHLITPEFFDMHGVSVGSIAAHILEEFGIRIPSRSTSRVLKIRQHLTALEKEGHHVALVFDECHRLNDKVITSLKNFWELTNGRYSRLLGIVLFGQPRFVETTLRDYKFREIAERVQVVEMPPLAKSAADYLAHKLDCVGGNINRLFDSESIRRICAVAKTPLALGNLANSALMEAYKLEEEQVVSQMLNLPDTPALRQIRRAA